MQTSTTPGILLPCPKCGEPEATITLHLSEGNLFTCTECEAEFSADDLHAIIRKWQKVLTWVEAMPTQADVDAE
jgi:transcription initiation factor IIE alpha subunit